MTMARYSDLRPDDEIYRQVEVVVDTEIIYQDAPEHMWWTSRIDTGQMRLQVRDGSGEVRTEIVQADAEVHCTSKYVGCWVE